MEKSIDTGRWARIKLFAMDVDGILTDGTVSISSSGEESKRFHVRDGLGLTLVRDAGITLAWISGRNSGATTIRARELRIPHLVQHRKDKKAVLTALAAELGLTRDEVCYMGDDIIDRDALAWAGIGVTVPDAIDGLAEVADLVTRNPGGRGAVREVCDSLLASRNTSVKLGSQSLSGSNRGSTHE